MLFKIFLISAMAVIAHAATAAADVMTVGAVHEYINRKWNVEIPYDESIKNSLVNMHYVMQAVDATNEKINRVKTSEYSAESKAQSSALASPDVVKAAVDTMVQPLEYHFFFTPATGENIYAFQISAAGTFYIDWGDGNVQRIDKSDVKATVYSHGYTDGKPASAHEIALAGRATQYVDLYSIQTITFHNDGWQLSAMRGCLGCIFPTLKVGQPSFYRTFYNNTDLTGPIPEKLFNGISGTPRPYMFARTFDGCSNLSGTIPDKLFGELIGTTMVGVFRNTFSNCKNLTGALPSNLFNGVSGAPQDEMFYETFSGCSGLSSINDGLFGDITGNLGPYMFLGTFSGCTSLTGPSATVGMDENKEYLYERWPNATQNTYTNATGLADYDCIPKSWGGGGTKDVGTCTTDDITNTDTDD